MGLMAATLQLRIFCHSPGEPSGEVAFCPPCAVHVPPKLLRSNAAFINSAFSCNRVNLPACFPAGYSGDFCYLALLLGYVAALPHYPSPRPDAPLPRWPGSAPGRCGRGGTGSPDRGCLSVQEVGDGRHRQPTRRLALPLSAALRQLTRCGCSELQATEAGHRNEVIPFCRGRFTLPVQRPPRNLRVSGLRLLFSLCALSASRGCFTLI